MHSLQIAIVVSIIVSWKCSHSRPVGYLSRNIIEYDRFLKSVNYNEPDEEFDDVESGQNSWELSGKFEGDIILTDQQQKVLLQEEMQPGLARNGLRDVSKKWPRRTLVYEINDDHFTNEQKQAILDGMSELERSSCVKFKERGSGDSDYVMIQGKRRGCYSRVGYQGDGAQVLNLTPHPVGLGCMSHGTIVHELLHALGFFHMQSHTKRDNYVKIQWDNILDGREHNFKKYNSLVSTDYGVPYDYDSVLHYSSYAFSRNGRKTIVPKEDFTSIGQRIGPSDKDILKLNRMYKCGGGGSRFFEEKNKKGGLEPFDSDVELQGFKYNYDADRKKNKPLERTKEESDDRGFSAKEYKVTEISDDLSKDEDPHELHFPSFFSDSFTKSDVFHTTPYEFF